MNDDTTSKHATAPQPASMPAAPRPGEGAAETAVRAVLAAHPWPTFGAGLRDRLALIPAAGTDSSTASPASPHPTSPFGTPSPHPPATPSARRPTLTTGGWATAGLVAAAVAVALWAIGQGRLRELRPADAPTDAAPAPTATTAGIVGVGDGEPVVPTGRLIFSQPGDENPVVAALDMRTGREERQWEAPTRFDVRGAVSPDGTRLAIRRPPDGDDPELVYVRHLDPEAPGPLAMAGPDGVSSLVWAPDGRALYYDAVRWTTPEDGDMPSPVGWELHRLTLRDDVTGVDPQPTAGPLSAGIQAGEDRVIVRRDAAALGDKGAAMLMALDERHARAAVALGLGENSWGDGITLYDLATGEEVEGGRIPAGQIEGFTWKASRDGSKVAYTNCLGCYEGAAPYSLRILTLATGDVAEIWADPLVQLESMRLLWAPNDRWLVWTAHGSTRVSDLLATPVTTVELPESFGHPIAFAPDGATLLLSTGQLLDLDGSTPDDWRLRPLPWAMPAWLTEWNEVGRVIAWAPDVDRSAIAATWGQATATPVPGGPGAPGASGDGAAGFVPVTPVATVAIPPDPLDVTAGPSLALGGWAPDGRWLAFWTAGGSDHYERWKWPSALHIVDVASGTVCEAAAPPATTHSDMVYWPANDTMAVRVEGRVHVGRPCGPLAPDPRSTYALPAAPPAETPAWAYAPPHEGTNSAGPEDRATSPDGRWLAETVAADTDGVRFTTTINRTDGTAGGLAATWSSNGGLGDMGLGGEWLPDNTLLIGYSYDQGPLLLDPTRGNGSGGVTQVAEAWFQLSPAAADPTAVIAWAHIDPDGDGYHAMLTGAGGVRLYHPHSGRVETLPSDDLWAGGFSADGRWLLLHGRDGAAGSSEGLWIRELESPDAPFRLIPESEHNDTDWAPLSEDGRRLAFADMNAGTVVVVSFPEGEVLARWRLAGYQNATASWSPDGRHVAAEGDRLDAEHRIVERALFLLALPAGP